MFPIFSLYIYIYNVGTQLVAWYSIVAKFSLLIQFHDVWGGPLLWQVFFSDFVFSFLLIHVFFIGSFFLNLFLN